MAADLINKKTRYEFRECLVGWTLREIEMEFDSADISCSSDYQPTTSGQRRSLVERYYKSLDFTKWDDVRKLLVVFENILSRLDEDSKKEIPGWNPDAAREKITSLTKWLHKDGFIYEGGKILSIGRVHSIPQVKAIADKLDAATLQAQISRMERAIDSDPALAIGTAKELVETVCKTILNERGKPVDPKEDLLALVKEVRQELQITPSDIPDTAKGAETIKRLLNNLATVVQGLAELRNAYGTGHGPDGRVRGLQARHARLAVGTASALATFLFETHQSRPTT